MSKENSNTGDRNTGDRNTGDGNVAHYHTGFFCMNVPVLYFFDEPTEVCREQLDFALITRLCDDLAGEKSFDCKPYLTLPNATEKRIKAIHKAHIKARKAVALAEAKEGTNQ